MCCAVEYTEGNLEYNKQQHCEPYRFFRGFNHHDSFRIVNLILHKLNHQAIVYHKNARARQAAPSQSLCVLRVSAVKPLLPFYADHVGDFRHHVCLFQRVEGGLHFRFFHQVGDPDDFRQAFVAAVFFVLRLEDGGEADAVLA